MSIYTDDIIVCYLLLNSDDGLNFFLFAQPGDVVAVNHGIAGRKEGLVIGSHYDYMVLAASPLPRPPRSSPLLGPSNTGSPIRTRGV